MKTWNNPIPIVIVIVLAMTIAYYLVEGLLWLLEL